MRRLIALSLTALGLSACVATTFPETTQELRDMPRGALAVKSEEFMVARSVGAVMNTFQTRGAACLHFDISSTMYGGTMVGGMRSSVNMQDVYRPRFESSGSTRTLVVQHYNRANIGNPGWYPRFVADVTPAAGGSKVTLYGPGLQSEFIREPIRASARGDTRPCPAEKY